MGLPIPIVGTTPGPDYATDINASLTLIDQHDHSSGYGVAITPTGLNINAALPFGNNNLTGVRSVRFQTQSSPLALAADLGCLYESGVDLYYNDGSGNQVRLTQSGGVAGSVGSIASLASPASATYVAGSGTFVWQSAANTPAIMDSASVIIRNPTAAANGVTIAAANALAAGYTLTLPAALPAATNFMAVSSTGAISAYAPVSLGLTAANIANATITTTQISATAGILGSQLSASAAIVGTQLTAGTITTTQIAATTIVAANIANATITSAKIAAATIDNGNIVSSINFDGKLVRESNKAVIVSNTNAGTNSLAMIRGIFNSSSAVTGGEGFTVSCVPGVTTVTFSSAFLDTPSVVFMPNYSTAALFYVSAVSTTGCVITGSVSENASGHLIVIGQRT